ncbi:MAG: hypothetical protein ACXQTV_00895 [Candidatus Hecatellaceae archaeon]
MAIRFSRHVVDKLAAELSGKGITEELLKDTIRNPDEVLYDSATGRWIALKMERKLAVVYEKSGEETFIITAIHSSTLDEVVRRRKRSGRWI